jgi:hypothetical protein
MLKTVRGFLVKQGLALVKECHKVESGAVPAESVESVDELLVDLADGLHAKVAIILISGRRMNTLLLRVTLRL